MSASENQIYFLLQRAAHKLKVEADATLMESCGLTTAQAAVVMIIVENGPVTQKYLSKKLSQRESAITAMASRLVKAGFISKERSTSDARAYELTATELGRNALTASYSSFDHINRRIDENISANEMNKLAKSLIKILKI